jgi:hypothetical protein
MSGLLESLGAAMPGVGFLVGGLIVAFATPRAAFLVAGIGILALVVIALLLRPGHERRGSDLDDDREDHGASPEPVVDERRQIVVKE